jgi:hypothetical protein
MEDFIDPNFYSGFAGPSTTDIGDELGYTRRNSAPGWWGRAVDNIFESI